GRRPLRWVRSPAGPPLYVSDVVNNRVVEVAVDGSGRTTVPTTGLSQPAGLAPDAAGDLYIADSGNNRVVKPAAGSGAQSTVPTLGLNSPLDLALDGSGNLYVADGFDNRVVRVREDGRRTGHTRLHRPQHADGSRVPARRRATGTRRGPVAAGRRRSGPVRASATADATAGAPR
ncbi:hypothetical protein ACWGIU_20900, partial [Streptomyces sp. NPDC054840]